MKKVVTEKDNKIETMQSQMTNLKSKNFEFRSKIMELEDQLKKE
jgi:peptidoglycan hydrolase CwlO-like protein